MTRPRAAVFSRESKGKGASIDDQDRENLVACDELNAEVAVTLRDTVGASKFTAKRRVGWPEITELVRSGRIDLLVVWEVSRADRVMDTWVPFVTACGERGVRFHITSLEMTYDPRKAAHRKALLDMGSTAEHETGQLSERSRKGIRGAVLAGKAHGPSSFGYTREYGPIVEGKRTFTEVRNEHIGVAVEIVTRISKRESIATIERDLNARPAAERGGRVWTRRAVKRVATNRAYIGVRRHQAADGTVDEAPGNWPPASDAADWEATFWRAQKVLGEPGRRHSGPSAGARHLLSYIMVCPSCDGSVTASHPGSENSRYQCHAGCSSVPMADADEVMVRFILGRLAKPDARAVFGRRDKELAAAEAEVARLERRLEEVRQAYDDEQISDVAFGRKESRLLSDLENAQGRVREARKSDVVAELLGDGEFTEKVGRKRWEGLSVVQQRAAVKGLFERIELHKAVRRLSRHATKEDRLLLAAERITVEWRDGQKSDG